MVKTVINKIRIISVINIKRLTRSGYITPIKTELKLNLVVRYAYAILKCKRINYSNGLVATFFLVTNEWFERIQVKANSSRSNHRFMKNRSDQLEISDSVQKTSDFWCEIWQICRIHISSRVFEIFFNKPLNSFE